MKFRSRSRPRSADISDPYQTVSNPLKWSRSSLGGPAAPSEWQGNLNLTYNMGPTSAAFRVQLEVHTHNQRATVRNVIGVLRGSEEPGAVLCGTC